MRILEKIALKRIADDLGKRDHILIKPVDAVAALKAAVPNVTIAEENKFITLLWDNNDKNLAKTLEEHAGILNTILEDNKQKD